MSEPAYIAVADDGHVTLFWGDGTEERKTIIRQGPRAQPGPELVEAIEALKAWAEANGYVVIVPAYDLEVPDIEIDLPDEDARNIDLDEVDDMLDDLFFAGDYGDYDEDYDQYTDHAGYSDDY
jgi:hypothetical protein